MGRAFTAAPLFLLGLLAAALGAATANVSGGGGGRQEPIEKNKYSLLLDSWLSMRGLILSLGDFLLNSGGRHLLDDRGLRRRRAVVLRLRAQVLRLPLRPFRRHQPLPAHCKPPPHFASILFLLFL
jgi:hypothetical protein